jgi:hypothetical protein
LDLFKRATMSATERGANREAAAALAMSGGNARLSPLPKNQSHLAQGIVMAHAVSV